MRTTTLIARKGDGRSISSTNKSRIIGGAGCPTESKQITSAAGGGGGRGGDLLLVAKMSKNDRFLCVRPRSQQPTTPPEGRQRRTALNIGRTDNSDVSRQHMHRARSRHDDNDLLRLGSLEAAAGSRLEEQDHYNPACYPARIKMLLSFLSSAPRCEKMHIMWLFCSASSPPAVPATTIRSCSSSASSMQQRPWLFRSNLLLVATAAMLLSALQPAAAGGGRIFGDDVTSSALCSELSTFARVRRRPCLLVVGIVTGTAAGAL